MQKRAGFGTGPGGGDFALAPMVIWMRLPALMKEANHPDHRPSETVRAVTEKVTAAAEGLAAAQLSLVASAACFWPEILSGRVPSLWNGVALQRSLDAALRPARRRVRANYRRLSKKGPP